MKKHKKYSLKNKLSQVKEPEASLNPSLLSMLNEMSFIDIGQVRVPGKSLFEIQRQTSLSAENIAGIVGVSKSKYYELLQLDDIGSKNIDALADFATLWNKGMIAFEDDVNLLNEWLKSRNESLGNVRPIELLTSRLGRRELEKAFLRVEYSVYG